LEFQVLLLNLPLLPGNTEEIQLINLLSIPSRRINDGAKADDIAGTNQTGLLIDANGFLFDWEPSTTDPVPRQSERGLPGSIERMLTHKAPTWRESLSFLAQEVGRNMLVTCLFLALGI
jgi:hypothetical protein